MYRLLLVLSTVTGIVYGLPPNQSRIVGGTNAAIANFPYQVSVRLQLGFTFEHNCGGSVYNERIIVTAAHCLYGYSPANLRVVAGVSSLNAIAALLEIERVVIHGKYSPLAFNNDVGLIVLARPLAYGPTIQPIGLAMHDPATGEDATVTGWGTTTEGGSMSEVLQKVKVRIIDRPSCAKSLASNPITENMICAGIATGAMDACHGDSGGPMTVNGQLAGIVSWGRGCGRFDTPKVYASVANLRCWIDENAAVYS